MFDFSNIKRLHLETSNVCNAACPMCPREVNPNFDKSNKVSLTVAKIKELFSDEFLSNLESVLMCGNHGDPAAAPECIDILKYLRYNNPSMMLSLHSNGGLRTEAWWSELGTILNQPNDICFFSIDGLEDTNHIYRVNTDFNKIMKNAQSFIDAGGMAHWEFLVFEHNEHQVDEAKQLAESMGFKSFRTKVSRRFGFVDVPHIRAPKGAQYQ